MAKRFNFRLAPLLKIREAKKKDAQRLLGKRMGELRLLQDRLQSLKEAQSGAFDRRRAQQGQPVDIEMWRSVERFLASVERRIDETGTEILKAQELVDEARNALTKAHREHLTLERLRDIRKEQYDLEVARDEQRQSDELALLRYQFKSPVAS
jgi:flagellar export protein FliJ